MQKHEHEFHPRLEDPWSRTWQPTPVFICLENPILKEPGRLVHTGSQSRTQLKQLSKNNLSILLLWAFQFLTILYNLQVQKFLSDLYPGVILLVCLNSTYWICKNFFQSVPLFYKPNLFTYLFLSAERCWLSPYL